jgi:hypothetical protein
MDQRVGSIFVNIAIYPKPEDLSQNKNYCMNYVSDLFKSDLVGMQFTVVVVLANHVFSTQITQLYTSGAHSNTGYNNGVPYQIWELLHLMTEINISAYIGVF